MDDLTPGPPQKTPPTAPPERIPAPSMSRPTPIDNGWTANAPVQPRRAKPTSRPPAIPSAQPTTVRATATPSRAAVTDPFRRLLALLTLVIWPFVLAGNAADIDGYTSAQTHTWLVTLLTTFALVAVVAVTLFAANTRLRILAAAAATTSTLAMLYMAVRAFAWSEQRPAYLELGNILFLPGMVFGGLSLFATGILLWRELTRFSLPPIFRPPAPPPTVPGQNQAPGRIAADRAAKIAAEGRYRRRLPVYLVAALPTLALAAWLGYDAVQWNWRSDSATTLFIEVVNFLSLATCLSSAALALYSHSAFWRIGWLACNTALTVQLALLGLTTALTLSAETGFIWLTIGAAALPCLACSFTALGWQLENARYPSRLLRLGEKAPVPTEDFQLESGNWDEANSGGRL